MSSEPLFARDLSWFTPRRASPTSVHFRSRGFGLRAASGAGRARPQRHRSLRRPTGSPTEGTGKRTKFVLYGRVEHGGSTLTRDGKTSPDRRGQQRGCLPRFPATFPAPGFAATQLDRHGFHTLGLHSTLRYVDTPLTPSTAKLGSAPLLPPEYDHQPDAATKGTQEAAAAPVFLWHTFPPLGDAATQMLVLSAHGGARRQHTPACQADHLRCAAQETGSPASPQALGTAFTAPSFHCTVRLGRCVQSAQGLTPARNRGPPVGGFD